MIKIQSTLGKKGIHMSKFRTHIGLILAMFLAISPVAVACMLVTGGNGVANNQIAPATATAAITVSLLCILFARYANASLRLARLFHIDYCCHGIPIDGEERCRGSRMPRQNAMTSHRSRGTSCEGYSAYSALRSWQHKPMDISGCLLGMSITALIPRRSFCLCSRSAGQANPIGSCVTLSLGGTRLGGALVIHGSLCTLTQGTRGPFLTKSYVILWMSFLPSTMLSTASFRSQLSIILTTIQPRSAMD